MLFIVYLLFLRCLYAAFQANKVVYIIYIMCRKESRTVLSQ